MSEKKTAIDTTGYFLYKELYPDFSTILKGEQIEMPVFCKSALFVLDTNSLLVPYLVGAKGLAEIKRIFETLLASNSIYVASHTLREFAKNRSLKISELYTEIDKALSQLPSIKDFNYPILSDMADYQTLLECKKEIAGSVSKYKKTLQDLQKGINGWNWFDPVTSLYSNIFTNTNIVDNNESEAELIADFILRMEKGIPPGNKDQAKPENAIGDYLIWKSILSLSKSNGKDIVFVTNDEKNDWMLKGNKKSISTRFELVDEFFRETGKHFACLNFADFLEIHGALEEVVTEVESKVVEQDIKVLNNNVFNNLNRITNIVKRFLSYANTTNQDDDVFIEDSEFHTIAREFTNSWERALDERPHLEALKHEFYNLDDILSKIISLNAEISYQAVRMKRSTYNHQKELVSRCREFLNTMETVSIVL